MLHARLRDKIPEDMLDLKPFLEASEHRAKIEIFYEAADARDSAHALHLAGVPRVTLHAQPGSHGYKLLRWLAMTDGFGELLGDLLGLRPEP